MQQAARLPRGAGTMSLQAAECSERGRGGVCSPPIGGEVVWHVDEPLGVHEAAARVAAR